MVDKVTPGGGGGGGVTARWMSGVSFFVGESTAPHPPLLLPSFLVYADLESIIE
jgi:hypothetical protein